jgi:hypothetical protein
MTAAPRHCGAVVLMSRNETSDILDRNTLVLALDDRTWGCVPCCHALRLWYEQTRLGGWWAIRLATRRQPSSLFARVLARRCLACSVLRASFDHPLCHTRFVAFALRCCATRVNRCARCRSWMLRRSVSGQTLHPALPFGSRGSVCRAVCGSSLSLAARFAPSSGARTLCVARSCRIDLSRMSDVSRLSTLKVYPIGKRMQTRLSLVLSKGSAERSRERA